MPSDNSGIVMFSIYSNDMYHLPDVHTEYFCEVSEKGLDVEGFTELSVGERTDSYETFKDMINKGILVPAE